MGKLARGGELTLTAGQQGGNYVIYLAGSSWEGEDQSERFYKEGIWETGHQNGEYSGLIKNVKIGDIIINKSSYAYGKLSYLRIKGIGVATGNQKNGTTILVNWLIRGISIDIVNMGSHRRTFAELNENELEKIVEALDEQGMARGILDEIHHSVFRDELQDTVEVMEQDFLFPMGSAYKDLADVDDSLFYEKLERISALQTKLKVKLAVKKDSPKKDPGGEVKLFYGTNRNKVEKGTLSKFYGSDLAPISYGTCTVTIPPGHHKGKIERPTNLWIFTRKENKKKDIVLSAITEMPEQEVFDWIKNGLAQTEEKSVLIFIHGYNTPFREAAWRTGQIAHDLLFSGVAGFFSWPSKASKASIGGYKSDYEKAKSSTPVLEKFIIDIIKNTAPKKLHIMAHSMGNQVLTHALNNLVMKNKYKKELKSVDQIILAAPDIDRDDFNSNTHPNIVKLGARRTLYASDRDKAMMISRALTDDRIRIGEAGDRLYVAKDLDTIDASNVDGGLINHDYIFTTKEVLADMLQLLSNGENPTKRGLPHRNHRDGLLYWLFPE